MLLSNISTYQQVCVLSMIDLIYISIRSVTINIINQCTTLMVGGLKKLKMSGLNVLIAFKSFSLYKRVFVWPFCMCKNAIQNVSVQRGWNFCPLTY